MKAKTKKLIVGWIIAFCVVGAIVLTIWSAVIMRSSEGYLEALKLARKAAAPQVWGGVGLLVVGYVLTFVKFKK